MTLVDASVWINHFRQANPLLQDLVARQQALSHPFVVGELCMGSLRNRSSVLAELDDLPTPLPADDAEVRAFVEAHELYGEGIGFIDAHLLVSTFITPDCSLWTRDKRLHAIAERFGRAAKLRH